MGVAASISKEYAEVIMKADSDAEKLKLFNKIQEEVNIKQNKAALTIQARARGRAARTIVESGDDLPKVFAKFSNFGKSKNQKTDGSTIDGTRFRKMLKNSGILHKKKFNSTSCDMLFTKCVEKGAKKLTFQDFVAKAIPEISKALGIEEGEVAYKIAHGNPKNTGTKAEFSKFYDDMSTWTGVATRGGPSTNDHVITLSSMMDRKAGDVRGVGPNSGH